MPPRAETLLSRACSNQHKLYQAISSTHHTTQYVPRMSVGPVSNHLLQTMLALQHRCSTCALTYPATWSSASQVSLMNLDPVSLHVIELESVDTGELGMV